MGEGYSGRGHSSFLQPFAHKLGAVVKNTRPYTLVAPAIGGFGIMLGAARYTGTHDWTAMVLAALVFALLNGAGNHINSIYDRHIDEVNKPYRPLVTGALSEDAAYSIAILLYVLTSILASLVNVRFMAFAFVLFLFSLFYSIPPLRAKEHLWLNNLWQATSRGLIATVAAWSVVASPLDPLPWVFGAVTGIWMIGAQTTKDFPDVEGDRQFDVHTLPAVYGKSTVRYVMAFFIGASFCLLGGVLWLGLLPRVFGGYFVLLVPSLGVLLATDREIDRLENNAAWACMYATLAAWYVGFPLLLGL